MRNPFKRTFIFLGYIRGPHIDKWVDDQIQEVYQYIQRSVDLNANRHEHIWDHMINDFTQTYQDIMSKEQADAELNTLKMEKGELDEYTSQFCHLAWMAMYQETDRKLCKDYFRGLPISLQKTMVQWNQWTDTRNLVTGLKEPSDTTTNFYSSRCILAIPAVATRTTPHADPPNNIGNKVLPKIQMPWTLWLDVPVPKLP